MALETVVNWQLVVFGGKKKKKGPVEGVIGEGYSTKWNRGEQKGEERDLHPSEVDVQQKLRGTGR